MNQTDLTGTLIENHKIDGPNEIPKTPVTLKL